MDLLRSCYTVPMVFSAGAAPVNVRWFFTRPGAKVFPAEHAFSSWNWNTDEELCDIGESARQPLPWSNGQRPSCAQGRGKFAGELEYFRTGQPLSYGPNHRLDVGGVPGLCCCRQDAAQGSSSAPIPFQGCGGVVLGGTAGAGMGPCRALKPLPFKIVSALGCGALDGITGVAWPQFGRGFWSSSFSIHPGVPITTNVYCRPDDTGFITGDWSWPLFLNTYQVTGFYPLTGDPFYKWHGDYMILTNPWGCPVGPFTMLIPNPI
jgi:hypothetical protein